MFNIDARGGGGGGGYSLISAQWGNGDVRPATVCFLEFLAKSEYRFYNFFCLNQGIDFIKFCFKNGIFSWTINSLHVCSMH